MKAQDLLSITDNYHENLKDFFERAQAESGSDYPEIVDLVGTFYERFATSLTGSRATMYFAIMFREFLNRGTVMAATEGNSVTYFIRTPYGSLGSYLDLIVRDGKAFEPVVAEKAGKTFPKAEAVPLAALDMELIELAITKAAERGDVSDTVRKLMRLKDRCETLTAKRA